MEENKGLMNSQDIVKLLEDLDVFWNKWLNGDTEERLTNVVIFDMDIIPIGSLTRSIHKKGIRKKLENLRRYWHCIGMRDLTRTLIEVVQQSDIEKQKMQ